MGNKESCEYIDDNTVVSDDILDDEMNVAETSIADSVGHEVGLYIKTCLSKFDDLRGEKLIKQLRGDNDRKADAGRGGAIWQRNKRDEEELACRPYFKSESYLTNARMCLRPDENENVERFIDRILRYANMEDCPYSETQNILIVNGHKKFTFLNATKQDIGNHPCLFDLCEEGETKMRREYKDQWIEGYDDDDRRKYSVLWVKLCEWKKDEDNEFITTCDGKIF